MIMNRRSLALILALGVPLVGACEDDENDVAVFRAQLRQINEQEAFTVPGATVEFLVEDGGLMEVRLQGLGLDGVSHPTFLDAGDSCPTMAADVNSDGIVDAVEGQSAYGESLLPLDGNLSTYAIEAGTFPFGTAPTYVMTDYVEDVVAAILGAPHVTPLDADYDAMAFEGRAVVMHGVAEGLVVNPLTVKGIDGIEDLPSTVPILCGTIYRVQ
jgi:hypothetical protein